ncbi:uncharacterized [Tachysurus ichikawai]
MLNEAGEKWIFRVKYGWRDLAALMKLRRQSVLAVSAHLHMHGNASAIHQRSTHSVSVHERARMILLNSQGDEERPFKVIRGVAISHTAQKQVTPGNSDALRIGYFVRKTKTFCSSVTNNIHMLKLI